MIERDFIAQKTKQYYIKKHIESTLRGVGISEIRLKKIPLGEKIIISANRPSLIVGSKGSNIRELTKTLKKKFKLENPQIEINEVKTQFLDANIVAQRIVSFLERFGSARFKSVGHKAMDDVVRAGALGVEILMSGKIPGSRAKRWRFYQGYLKKCGDIALTGVRHANASALLKSGVIGVQVSIMPPDLVLPDSIKILKEPEQVVEEVTEKSEEAPATEKSMAAEKKESTDKLVAEETSTENHPAGEETTEELVADGEVTPEEAAFVEGYEKAREDEAASSEDSDEEVQEGSSEETPAAEEAVIEEGKQEE